MTGASEGASKAHKPGPPLRCREMDLLSIPFWNETSSACQTTIQCHRDTWYLIPDKVRLATGRCWDGHSGYTPRLYSVQDAISGNNSTFWYHFRVIWIQNHQTSCVRGKHGINTKPNGRKPANSRPCWGCTPDSRFLKSLGTGNSKAKYNNP